MKEVKEMAIQRPEIKAIVGGEDGSHLAFAVEKAQSAETDASVAPTLPLLLRPQPHALLRSVGEVEHTF